MRFVFTFVLSIFTSLLICGSTANAQISLPSEISGLTFHVDATDIFSSGWTPPTGFTVTTWHDLSSNGYDLTALSAQAPYFEQTGFDGLRPSIRMELGDYLSGPDVLPTTNGTMTIFFFTQMVTLEQSAAVSLNGLPTSDAARYQFHTPWTNNKGFFDVGGTSGANRIVGGMPGAFNEEYLFTAINDLPGNRQILAINGSTVASDATGHSVDSSNGLRIGSTFGLDNFNGRFGEIIIYNRALTPAEVSAVEQYMYCKWKPSLSTETCADVGASKSAAIEGSPSDTYSLPGSTVRYTIDASNAGPLDADESTLVITDAIPTETVLKVEDIGAIGSGPVLFTDGTPSSGMSYNFTSLSSTTDDVDFSNDSGGTFTYVPSPDGSGGDANVTHIRISPQNAFSAGDSVTPTSFAVAFDVQLQ